MENSPELVLIVPVYNEQSSVSGVVEEWLAVVERQVPNFVFVLIDDGSTDPTPHVLRQIAERFGSRVVIHSRPNKGHGPTCLEGYRMAAGMGAEFVFQLDSDGQCDPRYFADVWKMRQECDVVYGVRNEREDSPLRMVVTRVLRLMIRICFRTACADANTPYRLMRVARVLPVVNRIPPDFDLANVALAVLLARDPEIRHGSVPIHFRARHGGEASVKASGLARRAMKFYRDMRGLL